MYIVRPAKTDDLNDLFDLAIKMAPGITTFPPDKQVLIDKIKRSNSAFNTGVEQQIDREFLFVLEDLAKNKVVGTAGVYNNIGSNTPFYSYKVIKQTQVNDDLNLRVNSNILHLTNAFQGGTEVGTLLLDPEYKHLGLGKFLAKSRYLLIANFMTLFKEPVFAELRGVSDNDNISPFWEAIGRHFFAGMDFTKADLLSATTDKQFIADMMPRHPIYVDLLPKEAQEAIGQANRKGQAALSMLFKEGFRDEGYIDIFDAGATVIANFFDIQTIRKSTSLSLLGDTTQPVKCDKAIYIASTILNDFSVTRHDTYSMSEQHINLSEQDINKFGFSNGQLFRAYLNC